MKKILLPLLLALALCLLASCGGVKETPAQRFMDGASTEELFAIAQEAEAFFADGSTEFSAESLSAAQFLSLYLCEEGLATEDAQLLSFDELSAFAEKRLPGFLLTQDLLTETGLCEAEDGGLRLAEDALPAPESYAYGLVSARSKEDESLSLVFSRSFSGAGGSENSEMTLSLQISEDGSDYAFLSGELE